MPESFDAQAEIVWTHIETILRTAGMDVHDLVSIRTYLADPADDEANGGTVAETARRPAVAPRSAMKFEQTARAAASPDVVFRSQFRMRPSWLGWAIEPVARAWFSGETRLRVAALERAIAAGAR